MAILTASMGETPWATAIRSLRSMCPLRAREWSSCSSVERLKLRGIDAMFRYGFDDRLEIASPRSFPNLHRDTQSHHLEGLGGCGRLMVGHDSQCDRRLEMTAGQSFEVTFHG